MPSLTSFGLTDYPAYIRILMFGVAALWVVAYGYLTAFPPKPAPAPMDITEFLQVFPTAAGLPRPNLTFAVTAINNGKATVSLTEITLSYFESEPVTSGFLTNRAVPATYVVAKTEGGLGLDAGDGVARPVSVTMTQPYAGEPFMEVTLPLSEPLEAGKFIRFYVMLQDASLLDQRVRKATAMFRFSNESTVEKTAGVAPP